MHVHANFSLIVGNYYKVFFSSDVNHPRYPFARLQFMYIITCFGTCLRHTMLSLILNKSFDCVIRKEEINFTFFSISEINLLFYYLRL